MTETQTPPLCPDCAGTGFIPPFMDPCPCGEFAKPDFLAAIDAAAGAATAEFFDDEAEFAAAAAAVDAVDSEWVGDLSDLGPSPVATEPMSSADTFAALEAVCDTLAPDEVLVHLETDEKVAAKVTAPPAPDVDGTWSVGGYTPKGKKLATPAQTALLARLLAERDPSHPVVVHAVGAVSGTLTARQASALIESLMAIPVDPAKKAARPNKYDGTCRDCGGTVPAGTGHIHKDDATGRWKTHHKPGECLTAEAKAALTADKVTEPGVYRGPEATFYRVRKSRSSARLYGEKVIVHEHDGEKHVDFAYNANAMSFLRCSDKLTWAEAREFGAAYGSCIACGRTLEDPRSLVQGYGATCAGHYGWPTVTKKQAEAIIAGVVAWDDVISGLGVLTS